MKPHAGSTSLFFLMVALIAAALLGPAVDASAEDLQMGDRGPRVRDVQQWLTDLGYDPGPADGIFGNLTRKAVRSFQIDNDLPPTGVADDRTYEVLDAVVSAGGEEDPGQYDDFEDFDDFDDWSDTGHEFGGHLRTVFATRTSDSRERFPFFIGDYWYGTGDVIYQGDDLDRISMQQTQMRLAWNGRYGNDLSSTVKLDLMQIGGPDHPFEEDTEVELDEAYLRHTGDRHSFTAGKVKVVWGVSDVFSPFNVLSSADMVDPFVNTGVQDVRGQWQLTWNYEETGRYRLETILIPVWNASLVPAAEHVDGEFKVRSDYWVPPLFSQLPSMILYNIPIEDEWGNIVWTDVLTEHVFKGVQKPKKGLESMSFGSRLTRSQGDWDLGAYFYSGLDPKPSPMIEAVFFDDDYWYDGQQYHFVGYSAELTMKYPRILVIGQSAESVLGRMRFKQESAVTYGRKSFPDLTTQEGMDRLLTKVTTNQDLYATAQEEGDKYTSVSFVLGADYTFTSLDLITSAQVKVTTRPGWETSSFGEQTTTELTFYAQRSYKEDQWTASLGGMVETSTGAALVSPRVRYTPMYHDNLEFSGGLNLFVGPEADESQGFVSYPSVLASYRDFSHAFVTARFLFGT